MAYTSETFHGFDSGSRMLVSKRASGTGWKFLRPAAVIAGFLVFAKTGRMVSFSIFSILVQNGGSGCNVDSSSIADEWLCGVVHGSSSDVKLASARITWDALSASWIGTNPASNEMTDKARSDPSCSSRISCLLSVRMSASFMDGGIHAMLTFRNII